MRRLLEPMLNEPFGTGTGKVTDSEGHLSGETDLIIFGRDIAPPITYANDGLGLYPCEATLATIEVKTTLTRSQLRNALRASSSLSSNTLTFLAGGQFDESDTESEASEILEIYKCLFAFGSDIDGDELDRYQSVAVPGQGERLEMFCVVGKGFWWHERTRSGDHVWRSTEPDASFTEVVGFVTHLRDALAASHWRRGRPQTNRYFQ